MKCHQDQQVPVAFLVVFAIFVQTARGYTVNKPNEDNSELAEVEIQYYPDTTRFIAKTEDGSYVREYPYTPRDGKEGSDKDDTTNTLDSWSVVWYIASFGGLIVFFLVVSCSEWCCRRNRRRDCARNQQTTAQVPDTPPPSYDHFAPPPYESLSYGGVSSSEKSKFDVYVVPVHTLDTMIAERRDDAPPSYLSASGGGYSSVYAPSAVIATPPRSEDARNVET